MKRVLKTRWTRSTCRPTVATPPRAPGRRVWRERLNDKAARQALVGVVATLAGGTFWGFSGTCASFLFANYDIDTMWLTWICQDLVGATFLVVVLMFDRKRLFTLLTTPKHLKTLLMLAAFGVFFNQFFYLLAVRLTNAGTATVLQCLQLVLIMAYTCVTVRRLPRRRASSPACFWHLAARTLSLRAATLPSSRFRPRAWRLDLSPRWAPRACPSSPPASCPSMARRSLRVRRCLSRVL